MLSCGSDDSTEGPTADSRVVSRPFVTTWTVADGTTIRIPVNPNISGYNYSVDWGDGSSAENVQGDTTHIYTIADTYTVEITGDFPAIFVDLSDQTARRQYTDNIATVESWGDIEWESMENAFRDIPSLSINAQDLPNLQNVENMASMFASTSVVVSGAPLNDSILPTKSS